MSVVGISFGNQNSYIAVARQGGIEVIANDYSLRATPTCVSYGSKKRVMGVAARQQAQVNSKGTVMYFKQLLGKPYDFAVKQLHDEGYVPCEMVSASEDHGDTAFKIDCLGEQMALSSVQVSGAFLFKLKQITEGELQRPMDACVVAVPNFFTPRQREAMVAACTVAGVKGVRLVDEGVCLGLAYGVYKNNELPASSDEGGSKRRVVLFLDVGHTCVQASMIAFKHGQMEVLASDYDTGVGGLQFDEVIRRHFREHIYNRYHVDVQQDPKAWMRLLDESEKLKKLMSTTAAPVQLRVECLVGELDVEGRIDRAAFDDLAQSLYQRIHAMLIRVISAAKLKRSDVDEVELVGGASRVPTIRQVVASLLKMEPKATMNVDESVARGAALQCAFLSPTCIIKPFEVVAKSQAAAKTEVEPSQHYAKETLAKWIETERRMQAADEAEKFRADAKNALEEFIYDSRKKVPSMGEEVSQEVIDEFHAKLADTEQWLQSTEDDEAADVTGEEYETRMALLRSVLDRNATSTDTGGEGEGDGGKSRRVSTGRDEDENGEKKPAEDGAAQD